MTGGVGAGGFAGVTLPGLRSACAQRMRIGVGRGLQCVVCGLASAETAGGQRAQAPEPARGDGRLVVDAAGAQQDDFGRIGHLREVVRGEADAFVRIGQAEVLAQRAVEEGVGGGGACGQEPSLRLARIMRSRRCRRASSGPQMAMRGCSGVSGAATMRCMTDFGEVREGAGLHAAHRCRELREIVDELRGHRAGLAGPDACALDGWRGAERFGEARDGFGGGCAVDQLVGEGRVGEIVELVEVA